MRYRPGGSPTEKSLWQARQQDSTMETRQATRAWNDYFAGYREQSITTPEGTFTVLVKGGSDATATGTAPWQIVKLLPDFKVRIFPSAIWDGKGNSVWPVISGTPAVAESFFDLDLNNGDTSGRGFIWLECTVDDTDDYHGIITGATITSGPEPTFNQRTGTTVNIALATFFQTYPGQPDKTFTLDPVRSFVFVIRRYGPPTSSTWDVEPL